MAEKRPYPTAPPPAHAQYYPQHAPGQQQPHMYAYGQPQQVPAGMQPVAYGAPPPYGSQGAEAPPPYTPYPQYTQYPQYAQGASQPPPQGYPVQQQMPRQTVVVQNTFDAGARFDGIAQQAIPPPPPGCAPNAAQLAQMQGHNVVGTQQKADWFSGGKGGGYTFW